MMSIDDDYQLKNENEAKKRVKSARERKHRVRWSYALLLILFFLAAATGILLIEMYR